MYSMPKKYRKEADKLFRDYLKKEVGISLVEYAALDQMSKQVLHSEFTRWMLEKKKKDSR